MDLTIFFILLVVYTSCRNLADFFVGIACPLELFPILGNHSALRPYYGFGYSRKLPKNYPPMFVCSIGVVDQKRFDFYHGWLEPLGIYGDTFHNVVLCDV